MKLSLAIAVLFYSSMAVLAQNGGPQLTQVLIGVEGQADRVPTESDITLKVNGKPQPLTGWSQLPSDQTQIALLIDNNNLQKSLGGQLDSLRAFATSLPVGVQLYAGYMSDGGIKTEQPFTTDHAWAASHLRPPSGTTRESVSPYTCLSKFVKSWPVDPVHPAARYVLLLTTGIDFRSEYAEQAAEDAQRAGVTVFAIYMNDKISASSWYSSNPSGLPTPIDDLDKVAEGTGGRAYYERMGQQLALATYLDRFRSAIASTYVASFVIPSAGSRLVQLKVETKLPGVKLAVPKAIRPGTIEVASLK